MQAEKEEDKWNENKFTLEVAIVDSLNWFKILSSTLPTPYPNYLNHNPTCSGGTCSIFMGVPKYT